MSLKRKVNSNIEDRTRTQLALFQFSSKPPSPYMLQKATLKFSILIRLHLVSSIHNVPRGFFQGGEMVLSFTRARGDNAPMAPVPVSGHLVNCSFLTRLSSQHGCLGCFYRNNADSNYGMVGSGKRYITLLSIRLETEPCVKSLLL